MTFYVEKEESTIIPGGLLVGGSVRRHKGGIELEIQSEVIHAFFRDLPSDGKEVVHAGWKIPLFSPAKMPRVVDVEFNSQETTFMVPDVNKGVMVANLSFLRAKDLDKGITIPVGPLLMESEVEDMKKAINLACTELYRSYIADLEVSFMLSVRECVKVA